MLCSATSTKINRNLKLANAVNLSNLPKQCCRHDGQGKDQVGNRHVAIRWISPHNQLKNFKLGTLALAGRVLVSSKNIKKVKQIIFNEKKNETDFQVLFLTLYTDIYILHDSWHFFVENVLAQQSVSWQPFIVIHIHFKIPLLSLSFFLCVVDNLNQTKYF